MPLVELKDFNVLIDNNLFFINLWKTNKKYMKNLLRYQEIMTTQEETYYIVVPSEFL